MLKRYDIKNDRDGEGWGIIVIDTSIGFFATVSDWGNYSFLWTHPGCEFRKFLCDLEVDYLRSKLLHGREKDQVFLGDATVAAIRLRLEEIKELDPLLYGSELEALDDRLPMERGEFEAWQSETVLPDPWSFGVWGHDAQCTAFCERVMPRFKRMLEDELKAEAP